MEIFQSNENFYNIMAFGRCVGTIHRDKHLWILDIPELGINEKSQYRNDLMEDAERMVRESEAENEKTNH